jgi:hypothetical protein
MDDRDKLVRKTPPSVLASSVADQFDEHTHPGMPTEDVLLKRTKTISEAVVAVGPRLTTLEDGHKTITLRLDGQDKEISAIKAGVAYMRGGFDVIKENAVAQQQERAEKREHELSKLRWQTWQKVAIAVVGAIGTALATYLGLR